jgi:hypothetical protein
MHCTAIFIDVHVCSAPKTALRGISPLIVWQQISRLWQKFGGTMHLDAQTVQKCIYMWYVHARTDWNRVTIFSLELCITSKLKMVTRFQSVRAWTYHIYMHFCTVCASRCFVHNSLSQCIVPPNFCHKREICCQTMRGLMPRNAVLGEIIYRRPRVLRAQNGITWHQPPHCLTADLPFMTESRYHL